MLGKSLNALPPSFKVTVPVGHTRTILPFASVQDEEPFTSTRKMYAEPYWTVGEVVLIPVMFPELSNVAKLTVTVVAVCLARLTVVVVAESFGAYEPSPLYRAFNV